MGTNINSIPGAIMRGALEGLESEYVPVIDRIPGVTRRMVNTPEGTVPIKP
jgi:hypothetical protein